MIVDFHTHVFPPEVVQHREKLLQQNPFFGVLYSRPKSRLAVAGPAARGSGSVNFYCLN